MSAARPAWWREFFDEDYLFLFGLALSPERTEAEVRGIVDLLGLREGARVLDLCCGDGRHAVPLQRRGMRVTGIDLSPTLIDHARQRSDRVLGCDRDEDSGNGPVPREGQPHFIRADARALPLRQVFDAALLLFNSIGYGTDADTLAMLRSAHAALLGSGELLLECVHRDEQVRRAQLPGPGLETLRIGTVRVHTERWIDPVAGIAHALFRFQPPGARPVVEKRFQHRLYTAGELCALLSQAGFAKLQLFGGYDGRPFALDAPLFVARCPV